MRFGNALWASIAEKQGGKADAELIEIKIGWSFDEIAM